MITTYAPIKKLKGFSIVECLLAILIGTTLIWQVCEIYKSVHRTHQLQNGLSKLLHHAMWFDDVMSQHIQSAGIGQCTLAKNISIVNACKADNIPTKWMVKPAKHTEVLLLSHCIVSPMGINKELIQTIYYLKQNPNTHLYTLYQKQQNKKAMAMQDDIQSLTWYLAYQTKQTGQLTAPQAIGVTSGNQVGAVAWKVTFSNHKLSLSNHKSLTRTFYGYMGVQS